MPFFVRGFICGLITTALPLCSSASSLLYTNNTENALSTNNTESAMELATAEILAYIESFTNINWIAHPAGGKYATIDNTIWHNATQTLRANQPAENLTVRARSADYTARHQGRLEQRDSKGGNIPSGVDPGDGTKHHAFFSCARKDKKSYTNVLSVVAGVGCGALMKGAQAYGTRVWVSKAYWTPTHNAAKVFITVTGQALQYASGAECGWAVGEGVREICNLADGESHGGTAKVYKNAQSSWRNGAEIGTISIESQTCSDSVPCDTPSNTVP